MMQTNALTFSTPVSRPKVHRLPSRAPQNRHYPLIERIQNYGQTAKFTFGLSALALGLLLIGLITSQFMPAGASLQPLGKSDDGVQTARLSDAMASTVPNKTVILKGSGDAIIGQITKITPPSKAGEEVNTVSEVDNRKQRELFSIINQY